MNETSRGNELQTMTIRRLAWTPMDIMIRVEGASNYLGGIFDLEYCGAAAKVVMMKITRASCAAIQAAKASPLTKLMVATVSVIRKIGYNGALASLPLKYTRTLTQYAIICVAR